MPPELRKRFGVEFWGGKWTLAWELASGPAKSNQPGPLRVEAFSKVEI
jgi:hypothetical protein